MGSTEIEVGLHGDRRFAQDHSVTRMVEQYILREMAAMVVEVSMMCCLFHGLLPFCQLLTSTLAVRHFTAWYCLRSAFSWRAGRGETPRPPQPPCRPAAIALQVLHRPLQELNWARVSPAAWDAVGRCGFQLPTVGSLNAKSHGSHTRLKENERILMDSEKQMKV